jgi:hypothetical protein
MSNKIQPKTLWELEELGDGIYRLSTGAKRALFLFGGFVSEHDDVLTRAGFNLAKELLQNGATEEQIAMTIWERLADILETTKQTIVVEDGK